MLSNIEHAPKEKSPRGRAPHLGQQKAATGIEAVTAFRLIGKTGVGVCPSNFNLDRHVRSHKRGQARFQSLRLPSLKRRICI
jgi:hypothetical protein